MIHVALNDLLQVFKDKLSAVFLVLMPLVFTVFFGILTAPMANQDNRIPLNVINLDPGGILADDLAGSLAASATIRVEESALQDREQLLTDIAKGDRYGLLEIPAGYSQPLYTGQPVQAVLTADSASQTGIAIRTAVQESANRIQGAAEAARLAVGAAGQAGSGQEDRIAAAYRQAAARWQNPPVKTTASMLSSAEEPKGKAPAGYVQSSPGILVQFAIFGLMTPGAILVNERKNRTFQRLLTTPVSRAGIIAGHLLAFFLVVFLQEFILVAAAQLFFGVNYLREPLAVLLIMAALALMAAGLGLLFGVVAKKDDQVILYALIAMFILAAMGGAWFPLEVTGKTFSRIGHLLPTAWAMDGFQNVIVRGLGLESVLLPAAVLLAYAVVFGGLSVWRYSKE